SLGTLSFPAFQGMLASMVPGKELESAVAINSLSLQVARFVGPAVAGFLLAAAGPGWVFSVNAVSFLAVLGTLALLPGSRALAGVGLSQWVPRSLALGVVGGFFGVVFIGLSTVAVQAMASDEMRARAMAVWAVAFVGMLPAGALVTGGLAALLGAGGAVFVDGMATLVGGIVVLVLRPEV